MFEKITEHPKLYLQLSKARNAIVVQSQFFRQNAEAQKLNRVKFHESSNSNREPSWHDQDSLAALFS